MVRSWLGIGLRHDGTGKVLGQPLQGETEFQHHGEIWGQLEDFPL